MVVRIDEGSNIFLKPSRGHANVPDGSAQKLWLSLSPHTLSACAYRPGLGDLAFEIKETKFSIDASVDKERDHSKPFRIPLIILEEDSFLPASNDRNSSR